MDHRRSVIATAVLACVFTSTPAKAQQIEIIHTNDLHSYIDHADDAEHGSYAAVKATIDSLEGRQTKASTP